MVSKLQGHSGCYFYNKCKIFPASRNYPTSVSNANSVSPGFMKGTKTKPTQPKTWEKNSKPTKKILYFEKFKVANCKKPACSIMPGCFIGIAEELWEGRREKFLWKNQSDSGGVTGMTSTFWIGVLLLLLIVWCQSCCPKPLGISIYVQHGQQ